MPNLLNMVKKEFQDLISSRMVLVILLGFFVIILFHVYYSYTTLSSGMGSQLKYGSNIGLALANWLLSVLATYFGPIVGVMIGCTSIANERHKNTINTLLVKPLFRDTIINGKIIGSLMFLALIIGVSIAFYTSCVLVLCGDSLASTFYDYMSRLPFVFFISLILISIFLVGSMLISLLIKNQAFALIIGTILVYISNYIYTADFVISMAHVFPEYGNSIINLVINFTPTGPLVNIRNYLFTESISIISASQYIFPEIVKFLFFIIILCVLCYIIFIRSDVA